MGGDPIDDARALAERLAARTDHEHASGARSMGVPGLDVLVSPTTTPVDPTIYQPVACLVLQGAKELEVGDVRLRCEAGASIVVSHELPLRSRITVASPDEPYVALVLRLDVTLLRRLSDDLVRSPEREHDGGHLALRVGTADRELVDAFRRLASFADSETEAAVLAPLAIHEIHYRLLTAEHGAVLRRLLQPNSHASRIARATAEIHRGLAEPLVVAELARTVGMSPSSFHQHFKAITTTTPLQYQKELRLLEARQLLERGDHTVTDAALVVGYQSPTQFSREYSRKFGSPPSVDRRLAADVA
ncbi:MAG: AraC family transcriptional regulator [Actinomycetota bacterium]